MSYDKLARYAAYLPSKKFIVVMGGGILALVLLLLVSNAFGSRSGYDRTIDPNAPVAADGTVKDVVLRDSNGNGIPDWEEVALGPRSDGRRRDEQEDHRAERGRERRHARRRARRAVAHRDRQVQPEPALDHPRAPAVGHAERDFARQSLGFGLEQRRTPSTPTRPRTRWPTLRSPSRTTRRPRPPTRRPSRPCSPNMTRSISVRSSRTSPTRSIRATPTSFSSSRRSRRHTRPSARRS